MSVRLCWGGWVDTIVHHLECWGMLFHRAKYVRGTPALKIMNDFVKLAER